MFKTICNYALKTYFRKRSFAFFSIISVVLFITSIMSSFIMCLSCINSYDKYIEENYGSYTCVYANIKKHTYENLEKSPHISCLGTIINYGTVNIDEFDEDIYTISFLDRDAITSSSIRLLQGREPENSTEIILEKSIADKLNVNLYEETELIVKQNGLEKTLNKEIVGICDDFSAQQLMLNNDSRIWPSIILTHKDESLIECNKYFVVTSKQDNKENLNLNNENHSEQIYLSQRVSEASFTNEIGKSTQTIISIAVIGIMIIALICLLSFFSLSSFVINEQVQNLSFLGASLSIKALFSTMHLAITFLISLPIGTVMGVGIGYSLSNYIISGLVEFYEFQISILSILGGVLISFIILILIRNVKTILDEKRKFLVRKDNRNTYAYMSKSSKSFIFFKWFARLFYRNKLYYIGIILSMMLCFFVLFIGGIFTETINKQYDINYQDDYKLKNTDGGFFSSLYIPNNPYAGFTDVDLQKILETGEVESCCLLKELNVLIDPSASNDLWQNYGIESIRESFYEEKDFYHSELKEYGLDVSGELYLGLLKIIDEDLLIRLLESDCEHFNRKNQTIVVCKYGSKELFEIGQKIRLLQVLAEDGMATKPINRKILELNLYISNIIILEPSDYLYDKLGSSNIAFICSENVLDDSDINLNYSKIYFNLKDTTKHTKIQAVIRQFKKIYPEMKVTSQIDNDAERIQLLTTLNVITIVLCIFIFIVCIFNVITIISGRYLKEKRLWGILRAMGINRSKVLVLHIFEILLIMIISIVANFVCLKFADIIIIREVIIFNDYVIFGYIASTILICLISTPIVYSIFRSSIISQLNYTG